MIPGNERSVGRLQNALMARGVEVITDGPDAHIHVSGHPARDELVRMYQWVRPKIALPVHGEVRHMVEHAALARDCQVPETVRGAQRHAGPAGARAGRDRSTMSMPAGWRATATP